MVNIINELTGCNDDSAYNFLKSLKTMDKGFVWVDIISRIREEVECKIIYGFDYQSCDTKRLKFEKINIILTNEYDLEIIVGELKNFKFTKVTDNEYILELI